MKSCNFFYAIVMGLSLACGTAAWGQTKAQEAEILKAVKSGKLKVTDEMIETQRALHPELKNYSNQQIRERLERKAKEEPSDLEGEEQDDDRNGSANDPKDLKKRKDPFDKEDSDERDGEKETGKGKGKSKGKLPDEDGQEEDRPANSRFPPELKRFGYEFFLNNPDKASMTGGNAPALPDYVLSAGDEIQVYTWGRETNSQRVVVDNNGMFNHPPLAPMRVAGMRFDNAQKMIQSELEKINGIKASIGLGKLKSIRVMVLGEAVSPGSYTVQAGATVTSVLFQCGGITEIGSLRGIQIRRDGRTVSNLDLYDLLLRGSSRNDIQLLPGDAVFIPVAPIQIAVTGMVKRPAIYEVKPGIKVLDVLDLAGGLSSNAFKGRVRLDRVESYKRKVVLDISMEKVGGSSNPAVFDGDILFVDQVLDQEFDVVYLKGNVNRPGRYEFKKGMSVKDLIPSRKELKSETFFNYGHIKRRAEDDERALLIPFSLGDVLEKGADVPLQPRDTIIVYSRYDLMDQSVVKAEGMIRRPATYPFVDQMRVSDLIIAAGGLTVNAYLPEAHILRLLSVGESDSLQSTLVKVNLSGLVENPADENNVELQPYDSLIVFPRSNFILPKLVTIHGAVKKSGDYELTQNMGIRELISQAEGLTKNSYGVNVEVVRRKVLKDSVVKREIFQVNLADLRNGKSGFALEDGDGIYVREVVNAGERSNVWVMGEMPFPGRYEFSPGERLSSVIHRAGGFSEHAYLRGAVFIRKSVKEQQLLHLEEISRRLEHQMEIMLERTTEEKERAGIRAAIEQRSGILNDIRNAPGLGRIVISLDRRFAFENSDWDISIENGDSLYIGKQPNTISIMGEVYSPTNVIFTSSNNSIGECLAKAGGVNEYGNYSNTYYISPDGTVLTPSNTPWYVRYGWKAVEPGGSIIVPPKGPKKDYLDALSKITQIIYNTAVSVGVVRTLF